MQLAISAIFKRSLNAESATKYSPKSLMCNSDWMSDVRHLQMSGACYF